MYKLLATDIDGTLLKSDGSISDKNLESIHKAIDSGCKVVLSSGRYYQGVIELCEKLGLEEEYHVADNGACIVNGKGYFKQICEFNNEYENLIKHLRSVSKSFVVTNKEAMWYETTDKSCQGIMRPNNGENSHYIKIKDLTALKGTFKICAYYEDAEEAKKILSKKFDGITGCVSHAHLVDFYPSEVSKYTAVLEVAKMNLVLKDEIIGVGDSDNDLELVENATLGISVKNATENLKSVSDVILDIDNNQDAISKVIEEYLIKTQWSLMC